MASSLSSRSPLLTGVFAEATTGGGAPQQPGSADPGSAEPAAVAAAHAVETIARIADAQAGRSGTGDAVSFGFKFGTENLTVRVEMRQGEVRTQFLTDSPELRAAIQSQWAGLSDQGGTRSYHFSAAEFQSADGRPSGADADARGGSRQPAAPFEGSSPRLSRTEGPGPGGDAPAPAEQTPSTAHYLHAVA
jgi:hypothetical protein